MSDDKKSEVLTAAINELHDLTGKWEASGKINPGNVFDIFVAFLVCWAEEQDDPSVAIEQLTTAIEDEFETSPGERAFVREESH